MERRGNASRCRLRKRTTWTHGFYLQVDRRMAVRLLLACALVLLSLVGAGAQEFIPGANLLDNPTFLGAEEQIPPVGWSLYGSLQNGHRISVVDTGDPASRALLLEDMVDIRRGNEGEIGLQQCKVRPALPGDRPCRAVEGASPDVTALQMFLTVR